jgi:hypothetical protein
VLLDAILHDLRAMPHRTQVPVDPLDQCLASVSKLTTHREDGNRRSKGQCRYGIGAAIRP